MQSLVHPNGVLTDNGTEFKNKLFKTVAEVLGMDHRFTSPYHPRGNGRIEKFHQYLKSCLKKHITTEISWDQVTGLACAAYNFLPNTATGESAMFLMFGRDPMTPLTSMLTPKMRYLGDEKGLLCLDKLRECHAIAAFNLRLAREKSAPNRPIVGEHKEFHIGDMVLLKDHTRGQWDTKYKEGWRITEQPSPRQCIITDELGHTRTVNLKDIAPFTPVKRVLESIPDYKSFGRSVKYVYAPATIEDLGWEFTEKEENEKNIKKSLLTSVETLV